MRGTWICILNYDSHSSNTNKPDTNNTHCTAENNYLTVLITACYLKYVHLWHLLWKKEYCEVWRYRSFATRVSQLKIWHFRVIGIERNVRTYTFNRYSVITQFAKLAAGEQLCWHFELWHCRRWHCYRWHCHWWHLSVTLLSMTLLSVTLLSVTLLSQMSEWCSVGFG